MSKALRVIVCMMLPLSVAPACGGGASSLSGAGGAGGGGTGASGAAGGSSSNGSSATSSGSSGTSSASSSTSSSGAASGDCASDADCPGGSCVPIAPSGFFVCQIPPSPATICDDPLDACCDGKPCPNDAQSCFETPALPQCGGPQMVPHNQCAQDFCAQDAECPPGSVCVPAGVLGFKVRGCLPVLCSADADCTAQPGGVCAPVYEPCCNNVGAFACVYPGGCRMSSDCQPGEYCIIVNDAAACSPSPPVCPL